MADIQSVWGIEIGQAGLKAIRLRYAEAANQVVAAAFDYVPHPKLLSQPDAVPDELVRQALDTFLSRNQLGSDLVAISLPGQTALAKFIQLPPVEASRVAQIVKYEAQQQIPFALEEVIWDFQPLGAGEQEGGFMLDAEVGLFAMKREQVHHHMRPFLERKVEVELVQIAPLGLFNFLCYDRLGIRPPEHRPDIEDYTVLLDMGADNTILLVTNGKKIWIRNVPIGGNHFTRALTKEMKLTFAKAEHLKCNATKSPDPRAVFQALRPVFNDYVSEIQRSIGYFSSVNRAAKIGRLVGVGNGFKLAGLQKFLQQNLQYEVDRVDNFRGLVGDHVLTAPLFQDNLLTFVVPYGIALQALKLTDIHTTLLPQEIAVARKIRRKKPWAVATAATLLLGTAVSTAGYANVWHSVSTTRFAKAEEESKKLGDEVSGYNSRYSAETGRNAGAKGKGQQLVSMLPTREMWMEFYKAIDECLPRDEGKDEDKSDIKELNRISLDSITFKKEADLGTWFSGLSKRMIELYMDKAEAAAPPTGAGYSVTLHGHHYHHEEKNPSTGWGHPYTNHAFVSNLRKDVIERRNPFNPALVTQVDVKRLGISHALITHDPNSIEVPYWPNGKPRALMANSGMPTGGNVPFGPGSLAGSEPTTFGNRFSGSGSSSPFTGARTPTDDSGTAKPVFVKMTKFVIQFAWKPTPPDQRKEVAAEVPAGGDANTAPVTSPALNPPATSTAAPQAAPTPAPNVTPSGDPQ